MVLIYSSLFVVHLVLLYLHPYLIFLQGEQLESLIGARILQGKEIMAKHQRNNLLERRQGDQQKKMKNTDKKDLVLVHGHFYWSTFS